MFRLDPQQNVSLARVELVVAVMRSTVALECCEEVDMNRRDEELLAKQMCRMVPPRNDGLVALTVLTVFLIGLVLGGTVFAPNTPRLAPHEAIAAISTGASATFQR